MPQLKNIVVLALLLTCLTNTRADTPQASQPGQAAPEAADVFADKPYSINMKPLRDLDPKPLKLEQFAPDPNPRAQGFRIISTGRVFPVVYEIITVRDTVNPGILDAISKSLEGHADIILKERATNDKMGDYLHYFQRASVDGKPHHVSSNYIFVKGKTLFHLAASNYAASMMQRKEWGPEKPDTNAEAEVMRLMQALVVK